MSHKPPLVISTSKPNASIIWLHGLGADGHDFETLVQELDLPNVRFILPHAPAMAITRNNGYVMPAWYDLYGNIPIVHEDEKGIVASQHYIYGLIEKEIALGIPSTRIVLAGFSQGGAMALHTGLRFPKKLAGILALSTYLPLAGKLAGDVVAANAAIAIFMAHGLFDEVISMDTCKLSLSALQDRHYLVDFHEYKMAHTFCAEEIQDIRVFLQQVLQQDLVE